MLFIFASFLLELFFLPPHCNLKTKSGIKSHGALPDVNHCFCPLLSTMSMKDWLVILLTVNLHKLKIWTSHKEKWPASVSLATFTISLFSSLANFGNYICITTVGKFPVWRILKTLIHWQILKCLTYQLWITCPKFCSIISHGHHHPHAPYQIHPHTHLPFSVHVNWPWSNRREILNIPYSPPVNIS